MSRIRLAIVAGVLVIFIGVGAYLIFGSKVRAAAEPRFQRDGHRRQGDDPDNGADGQPK